jgi:hypothetical protein
MRRLSGPGPRVRRERFFFLTREPEVRSDAILHFYVGPRTRPAGGQGQRMQE